MVQEATTHYNNWLEGAYYFAKGIPGFEMLKDFQIKPHNELFSFMVSIEDPDRSFIIVNPFDFYKDYEFELSEDNLGELGISSSAQVGVRCIVTWHTNFEKASINLLAPLVFNLESKNAKQLVLQNTKYTTKHSLWDLKGVSDSQGGDDK